MVQAHSFAQLIQETVLKVSDDKNLRKKLGEHPSDLQEQASKAPGSSVSRQKGLNDILDKAERQEQSLGSTELLLGASKQGLCDLQEQLGIPEQTPEASSDLQEH